MNRPPMMRRMSKRLAARAALISSSSVAPVGAMGSSLIEKGLRFSGISGLLGEDDVQDDEKAQGHAPEQPGRAPPQLVARVGVLLALGHARQSPDEAAQVLVGLGLGEQRD